MYYERNRIVKKDKNIDINYVWNNLKVGHERNLLILVTLADFRYLVYLFPKTLND